MFLTGLIVLIIPDNIAVLLGIKDFRIQYRQWISLLTLLAGVFLLCHVIRRTYQFVSLQRQKRKLKQIVLNQLSSLSPPEKIILYFCIRSNSQTVYAPHGNSFLQSLCSKGIMSSASGTGSILSWPYTVISWAWEYLKNHPDIFSELKGLDEKTLMDQTLSYIKSPLF